MSDPAQNPADPSAETPAATASAPPKPKASNPVVELLVNILIPAMMLKKLSGERIPDGTFLEKIQLGPTWAVVAALALPVGYGLYDFATRRKINFFSILGFVSTLLTGLLLLVQAKAIWIACKEALIPLLFGAATMISLKVGKPLIKTFFFNDQIIDTDKVETALTQRGNTDRFEHLMAICSGWIGLSFLVSAILNFALAMYLLTAEPGSEAFNEQLGTMMFLSYPVIVVPSMIVLIIAFVKMVRGIKTLTGYTLEDVMRGAQQPPTAAS